MPMRGLPFGEDVLQRRRVRDGFDDDGNDIWTDVNTQLRGVAVWPRYSNEIQQGRDTVITGLSMFLPPDADIEPTDHFLIRGTEYEVEGEPGFWRSALTGKERGVECALKRVTG